MSPVQVTSRHAHGASEERSFLSVQPMAVILGVEISCSRGEEGSGVGEWDPATHSYSDTQFSLYLAILPVAANALLSVYTPSAPLLVRIPNPSPTAAPRPGRAFLVPHFTSCPFVCLSGMGHPPLTPGCHNPVFGCLSSLLWAQHTKVLWLSAGWE